MPLIDYTKNRALFTDLYELTMIAGYYLNNMHDTEAVFDLFIRKNPFGGGYTVVAGIKDAIDYITHLQFTEEEIDYLQSLNLFPDAILDWLSKFRFTGTVTGVLDGTIIFPHVPILTVTAPLAQAQLIETALLNIVNFQSLVATKAARICYAASPGKVLEFGLRRAQGDGGMLASKAAIIGGCVGTSNVRAGMDYGIMVSGTQAHSWIQSYPSEIDAFRAFAEIYKEKTILLVDTYDTLQSGVPHAIQVAKEMQEKGIRIRGIRIDSGDLAWLAVEAARKLDEAGLTDLIIVLSNELDEYLIESLITQIRKGAPLDDVEEKNFRERVIKRLAYGVGTKLATGGNQAALGGVYKLVEYNHEPRIKISENVEKITNPGKKQIWRVYNDNNKMIFDVLGTADEKPPQTGETVYHPVDVLKSTTLPENITVEPLHTVLIENGKKTSAYNELDLHKSQQRCQQQLEHLDHSHKRFLNPHIYKVSLTQSLFDLKMKLIKEFGFKK